VLLQNKENQMDTQTISVVRILRAAPERVYQAFTQAQAWASWLPPMGFVGQTHELDARVGGQYLMSFTHFASGNSHSFGGEYLELEPGKRIKYTAQFKDMGMDGVMTTTIDLIAVGCGTELRATQEGVPVFIPADACQLGWHESMIKLAQLVEPEIPM
jgi:uncharacterized protein YndB with AHSA1/START domain